MKILGRLRNGKGFYLFDGVLVASVIFLVVFQRPSLQNYERRCREATDPKEKEKIALAAVAFLIHQNVPDSIAHQVNQEVDNENLSLPPDTLLFPEIPAIVNDSLAGLCDGLLTENLPKLYWMRRNHPDSVRGENFSAARKIAAQIDGQLNYSYWMPLMDFLDKANAKSWHIWRAVVKAADLSRTAYTQSQFERAKLLAVVGFHKLVTIPDRRLYLTMCFRLQNAIAEGPESMFNIGFALADWVTRESRTAGYFLRIVGMKFNMGNQFFLFGRRDEALEKFKEVLHLSQQWRHYQSSYMRWYNSEGMERITAVLYELGDYSGMMKYLNQYGKLATTTRQKTLYHLNLGLAARLVGDLQKAEEELQKAIVCGKGEKPKTEADPLNVWYAYLKLGGLYLEYHLPEKALFYFQTAKAYGASLGNLLNAERLSDYWLHLAQAFVQKQDMVAVQKALDHAKSQFIDSPVLQAKSLLSAAQIHENLGQMQEAAVMLKEAREICNKFGMTIYEINAILQQTALSFKAQKGSKFSAYPEEELENLITRSYKSGDKQQLVNSLALAVEAAIHAGRFDLAKPYSNWLLRETEALSRLYDQEQRLIFFQHSTYENVKAAIELDIRLRNIDSAFAKLDYVKSRALRKKIAALQASKATNSYSSYANIDMLRKQLQPDEAIVDYMLTEDTLYAFVLTSSQLQIFPFAITRHELRANVLEYLAQLTPDDRTPKDYDEQRLREEFLKAIRLSHYLYTKLLGGMMGCLEKINRLYIIPDEFLHALPFSTLALRGGMEPEFLIEQKAIMYLPAASLFSSEKDTKINELTRHCMLASVDTAMYGARDIADCLTKLGNEKVSLKMHWENPTELETSVAGPYQSFFFYAHAEANWDDPWQSYIQIPLKPPRLYGKLTYADVDSIDWRSAVLVILAGCETTGNRIYSGAGLSGLQRSFLGGGAKQVLATFWKVDAAQVAWQMSEFLGEWYRHGDAILALQRMQQFSIAKLKTDPYLNNCPHPRYWGAYNLIGRKVASYSEFEYASHSLH